MTVIAIAAAICGALIPAIRISRDAAMEMACRNNIKQIGLALLSYEQACGHLPLAIQLTEDGRLWRSWRTHVYPNFIEQMPPIYDATSSWDSQANIRLLVGAPIPLASSKDGATTKMTTLDRFPSCFVCPSCGTRNRKGVNYVVVRGELTAFPKSGPTRLSDISDGLENTILVVESINCNPDWTEPRDLDFETMQFTINSQDGPSISSLHRLGALACFADGEVYCITPGVTEPELKAMLTISGTENVKREDLVARGILFKR